MPLPVSALRSAFAASFALLAGACAPSSEYPSLAPRPIEDISLAEPAPRPPAPSMTPEAAAARFAPLLARVRAADADFARALEGERPSLAGARAAPVGSTAWGAAQQAYSRVIATRGEVQAAVSAVQEAGDGVEVQSDPALAAAAAQALGTAKAIDAREAQALQAVAPRAT